jgi:predicted dehydrogenase
MVKEARQLIKSGAIGQIRKVIVEYPQGWLSQLVEASGQKQASWRTDPARSGAAGGVGDIGTHAENLAEYITGLQITELSADLTIFVEGRMLDDDANISFILTMVPKAFCTIAKSVMAKKMTLIFVSMVNLVV